MYRRCTGSALRRLPNAVVVHHPFAGLEAPGLIEGLRRLTDHLPGLVRGLEDGVVGEVLGHLLLVPAFAHQDQSVRSSVIMQEHQQVLSLLNGLLQSRKALRSAGIGQLADLPEPVLVAALVDRVRPLVQPVQASLISSGAPCGVAHQGLTKVHQDLFNVHWEAELMASLDKATEVGPLQVVGVGEDHVPFLSEGVLVRLVQSVLARAVLEVVLKGLGEVQLHGSLGIVAQNGLELRPEPVTHHDGSGYFRLGVLVVHLRVAKHVPEEEVASILVAEVELEVVATRRARSTLPELFQDCRLHSDEVGLPLSGWDVGLNPVKALSKLHLVPVLQLLESSRTFRVEPLQPG